MLVAVMIWLSVFVFSLLVLLFIREALALTLFLSSLNALAVSFFGASLVYGACIFLISYAVLLTALLVTNALMNRMQMV